MSGIFGAICASSDPATLSFTRGLMVSLLEHSVTEGREAAGIAVHDGTAIRVLKHSGNARDLVASARFQGLFAGLAAGAPLVLAAHSRLAEDATEIDSENNQPVVAGGSVALHNGTIANASTILRNHPELGCASEHDSEVLAALLRLELKQTGDLAAATRATYAQTEGSASIAMLFQDLDVLLLATNTGSLFKLTSADGRVLVFSSERFILQRALADADIAARFGGTKFEQVRAGQAFAVSLADLQAHGFSLAGGDDASSFRPNGKRIEIVDHSPNIRGLRRCTKCVLPETYPYVDFDEHGVCRYCRTWKRIQPKGEEALLKAVEPYRRSDGKPDVIVAFSGGRDSSYGLHYVKTVLGMNPVAFTYDWGMVTDLARRNQARVCGKLGVEHIIRSADITAKRRYVRKNVEAWLKKPELGMVTLLMAGDKEFYQHARILRNETGIKLVIFCTGNMIEDAPYKVGLMGVRQDDHGATLTGMSRRNKLGMLWYFAKNYAKNPSYINESLLDTFNAYWQTFVVKDDFLYLFHYLPWHEDTIVSTIRREYDWEVATDTNTTWRIGDGTAPFYNYAYYTMAGFTEDECMLSNMVREGMLDRDEALRRAFDYSRPRWPSIREYAELIGFSFEEAIEIINKAPKLY